MFNRYWRIYPWYLQLFLFIMMIFVVFSSVYYVCGSLIQKIAHVSTTDLLSINENSSRAIIQNSLLLQFCTHAGIFLLPSLLFSYLAHPRPLQYLGLRAPGKSSQWLWVTLMMLGATPVFIYLNNLMELLPLGKWADDASKNLESVERAFLKMNSFSDFIKVFLTLAVLPALGEEMLFRGVLFRFSFKRNRRFSFSIIITAIMFAFLHYNVYGFISIFLAGVLLGVIYYLTQSLWCNILAHMIHNGLQIAILYFGKDNKAVQTAIEHNQIPVWFTLLAGVVFMGSLAMLLKNKTPLPPDWAEDFSPEELLKETQE
jgi:uncharacterized protein